MDVLSKNKQKKQLRNPHKTFDPSLKRKLPCGRPWGGARALDRWAGGGPDSALPRQPAVCAAERPDWLATVSGDTRQGLHVGGRSGRGSRVQLGSPRALFPAKYAKCDQCGNPKVSPGFCQGRAQFQGAAAGVVPGAVSRLRTAPGSLGGQAAAWGAAPVVRRAGSMAFLCPGQQVRVQPVPGLLQEASFPGDCGLPR